MVDGKLRCVSSMNNLTSGTITRTCITQFYPVQAETISLPSKRGMAAASKNTVELTFFLCISLPLRPAMDLLVCVADVWVPGIGRLWPDIYFGIHSPRRKETIETFLEVAGPGIEPVTSRSRQRERQHGYARLHAKPCDCVNHSAIPSVNFIRRV